MPTIAERAVGVRHPRCPRRRRRGARGLRGRRAGGRARPRRRRADADRVGLAAVARPRGPRPGEVRAREMLEDYMANHDPVKQLRGVPARRGRRRRRRTSTPSSSGSSASSTRATSTRSALAVPRARRRDEGPVGRGRLLGRASPAAAAARRHADGDDSRSRPAQPDTAPSRAASAPRTARPRT